MRRKEGPRSGVEGSNRAESRPSEITMPKCNHCGSYVSNAFARVFADEHGEIRACPGCSANAGIAEVALNRGES